jgi:uncharacterized protein with PIN domain
MAARYTIDVDLGIVHTHVSGILTNEDMMGHQNTLRKDPKFKAHFNQLANFLDMDEMSVTAECIKALSDANPYGKGSKRALVVNDELAYGFARMFEMRKTTDDEVIVFKELKVAKEWLGLTNTQHLEL